MPTEGRQLWSPGMLAHHVSVVIVLVATKPHRLDENLGAVDLVLDAADLARIDEDMARIRISGERLPEAALKMTGK